MKRVSISLHEHPVIRRINAEGKIIFIGILILCGFATQMKGLTKSDVVAIIFVVGGALLWLKYLFTIPLKKRVKLKECDENLTFVEKYKKKGKAIRDVNCSWGVVTKQECGEYAYGVFALGIIIALVEFGYYLKSVL